MSGKTFFIEQFRDTTKPDGIVYNLPIKPISELPKTLKSAKPPLKTVCIFKITMK
jgi:hypothetical protein